MNTFNVQQGMTLPEILVALVISLVLSLGAFEIYRTSRQTYALQEDAAFIQENGRYIFSFLTDDIRLAGVIGCMQMRRTWSESGSFVHAIDPALDQLRPTDIRTPLQNVWDFRIGLRGYDGNTGVVPNEYQIAAANRRILNSDAIVVKVARGPGGSMNTLPVGNVLTVQPLGEPFGNLLTGSGNTRTAILSDCRRAVVFGVNGYNTGSNQITAGQTISVTFPPNEGATIYPVESIIYLASITPEGLPALAYRRNVAPPNYGNIETLFIGVENLQFQYALAGQNNFQDASLIAENQWDQVIAVRVGMIMRSENRHPAEAQDISNRPFMGQTVADFLPDSDSEFFRRTYETVVRLRNYRPIN